MCDITDLPECLPEVFFQFILDLINTPIEVLLDFTKDLLTEPVNLTLFIGLWAIIIYIISLFYGLFFLFSGFNFIVSGYDSNKRENAKSWMANTILMILFVQASYFLYDLTIDMSSKLSDGVLSLIDNNFFILNNDFSSLGLNLVFLITYLLVMLVTVILLGLRYLIVSIGVVFLPIGIFLYFIPPLQSYGKMIINVLLVVVFIPFIDAIVLLGSSMLVELSLFEDFNIIAASIGFLTVDLLMIFLIAFAMIKAAVSVVNTDVGKTARKAVKYFA